MALRFHTVWTHVGRPLAGRVISKADAGDG